MSSKPKPKLAEMLLFVLDNTCKKIYVWLKKMQRRLISCSLNTPEINFNSHFQLQLQKDLESVRASKSFRLWLTSIIGRSSILDSNSHVNVTDDPVGNNLSLTIIFNQYFTDLANDS